MSIPACFDLQMSYDVTSNAQKGTGTSQLAQLQRFAMSFQMAAYFDDYLVFAHTTELSKMPLLAWLAVDDVMSETVSCGPLVGALSVGVLLGHGEITKAVC